MRPILPILDKMVVFLINNRKKHKMTDFMMGMFG